MTFLEFQEFCESNKSGDIKLPQTVDEYKPLIQESLEYIAKRPDCIPIHLVTNDLTKEDLRFINISQIMRRPIAPSTNEDKIDIDEQLVYAVAYDLLSNRTKNTQDKAVKASKRDEEISNYIWNSYKVLQDINNE